MSEELSLKNSESNSTDTNAMSDLIPVENKTKMHKDSFNINKKSNKKPAINFKKLGIPSLIVFSVLCVISLVLYLLIISPAMSVIASAKNLKYDLEQVKYALTTRDLVTLEKALDSTEQSLENLRISRDDKFGWLKNTKIFKINEYYSDSDHFINSGLLAVDALRETAVIVTPFADAAGLRVREDQEIAKQEGLMEAFQTWISLMPEVAQDLDSVILILSDIGDELSTINTHKYPEEIRGIRVRDNVEFAKKTLSNAKDFGPDIKEALYVIPNILGINSIVPKRYMIIMQNDKELRPTGGFWTNYATFKIQDALLQSDFTSKDFYSIDYALDVIDAYYDFPDAPPAYSKYLKVERWYARDTNSSPDLPTSIKQFEFYYDMAKKISPAEIKPVDGFFTIDTTVIEELMEITGPVTLNGITYSTENVVLELEKIASLNVTDQINRKGVLGQLMEAMLVNVFESEISTWSKLIDKFIDLSVRKHIQGYIYNESAQALLEKYGFAGAVKQEVEGDYAYVVSTNLGGDKTNWFVSKVVDHKLENDNGRWLRTVTVNYSYPYPDPIYGPFIKRFRDWVRLYVPIGSELVGIDGSEDVTGTGEELNKTYFSAYIELGPDESKTLTFRYYLPEETIINGDYNLLIQKQSGIETEIHTVEIKGEKTELILVKDETFSAKIK